MINKKLIVLLILAVVLVLAGFFGWNWWETRQLQIKIGLAEGKFPYHLYTKDELAKMYPQIKNADVPTRTAPEQTYVNFRKALETNNINMAIEQLSKESSRYAENKSDLELAYKENRFPEIYKSYPEKITQDNMYEAIAQYEYDAPEDGKVFVNTITFIKDSNGDWKLNSL